MLNGFSVDVEEWFHVCGVPSLGDPATWPALPSRVRENTRVLLDRLDACQVRATFFTLGWVAERYPDLVETIVAAGHEIGSHGHLHRRVYELDASTFAADLDTSRRALAAAGAGHVVAFRAPEWSINDRSLWALDVLAASGFMLDSSMTPLPLIGNPAYPRQPHRRSTAHGTLIEVPPMVTTWLGQRVPLGGGWGLRMSRPRTVLAEIERRNASGETAVLFVHPWELDPEPPRTRLPLAKHFVHYFRLNGFAGRLTEILRGARFGPLSEVAAGHPH
ncbi:MAG: polysaccharide deacetylase family protein [Vicinamibacterales bacterium]